MAAKIKTILIVCTGNSCRSVMAAGLLDKMLKSRGDYKVTTAGTQTLNGLKPTVEAIQVMSEQGIDVSGHRSTPLSGEIIREADLILTMEEAHKRNILSRSPEAQNKVHLLSEFARIEKENRLVKPDIPDPIGRSLDFYRSVFDIIKESILRTVKEIEEHR